jgi:mono/diheme cytochrome c family protein
MRAARIRGRPIVAALCFCAILAGVSNPAQSAESGNAAVKRGAYLFAAAGCATCHTDTKKKGALLAGGRAIKTPFGTFFGPNITPHPKHGIGKWSDEDFIRALREGIAPDGSYYLPVFPYPSYTGMTDTDMKALKAYIFTLPAVARASRPHEVGVPFRWRALQPLWRSLYFKPGPFKPDPSRSGKWNRGAYLARAVGHCGECHTPRTLLGGSDNARFLAGTEDGPDGESVPNITPDPETGIGKWTPDEIADLLETGGTPDGDFVGSLMAEVVESATGKLTAADRATLVIYLRSLPPIRTKPPADKPK